MRSLADEGGVLVARAVAREDARAAAALARERASRRAAAPCRPDSSARGRRGACSRPSGSGAPTATRRAGEVARPRRAARPRRPSGPLPSASAPDRARRRSCSTPICRTSAATTAASAEHDEPEEHVRDRRARRSCGLRTGLASPSLGPFAPRSKAAACARSPCAAVQSSASAAMPPAIVMTVERPPARAPRRRGAGERGRARAARSARRASRESGCAPRVRRSRSRCARRPRARFTAIAAPYSASSERGRGERGRAHGARRGQRERQRERALGEREAGGGGGGRALRHERVARDRRAEAREVAQPCATRAAREEQRESARAARARGPGPSRAPTGQLDQRGRDADLAHVAEVRAGRAS